MSRLFQRALLLLPAAGLVAACGNNRSTIPTAPTTTPTVLTETFSGTLARNAAVTHPFAVTDAGAVTVFLITSADTRDPNNNAVPIGVSLGTWNGATCAIVIANDNVAPGSSISGRATAAGNLCVRVFDVGFVPGAATYELLIDHF